ncbi:MAG: TM1266 family iron-only hydrogenase system putative regulator [Caldisericaceae bacterium]|uniref:TM1266 family iron-only hydrogenase system putative regulator n=1 Tax=Caldisericum sp. TaxID=2499687 RepID=UPI003D138A66
MKRLGFIVVILKDRKSNAPKVNEILSEFGDVIIGRMGLAHEKEEISIISLIIDATTDEIGSLTGKLGQIEQVEVFSGLSKGKIKKEDVIDE